MRNNRADVSCYLIVALLFLAPFGNAGGNVMSQFKRCDIHIADKQCGENERCFQSLENAEPECTCKRGYELEDGHCVEVTTATVVSMSAGQADFEFSSGGGGSVTAGLLIPTFLIVMTVLLYFVARRYKWLQRVRQLRPNHYGNVLVTRDDDDDDDSPIA